jgi:hypothetical protein
MTTERTNRGQEQQLRVVLKRGGFSVLGNRQDIASQDTALFITITMRTSNPRMKEEITRGVAIPTELSRLLLVGKQRGKNH